MKFVIDAMGGDNAPAAIVEGVIRGVNEKNYDVILCGDEELIKKELDKYSFRKEKIEIVSASEIITNDEDAIRGIRRKTDSSIVKALNILKENKADALICAGSTGALIAGAVFILGRLPNVQRPALMPVIPTDTGCSVLLDVGANADCRPEYLFQFAVMGSCYAKNVMGISNPKIGLVNIGEEKGKGTELTREAYKLLEASDMNFTGNIEAREIPFGKADVIVTDGFTGNVILKFMEGMGKVFADNMKSIFKGSILGKLSALLVLDKIGAFKKKLDYTEHGGAPLMGVNGAVIKAHGSSNAKALFSALLQAEKFVSSRALDDIRDYLKDYKVNDEEKNND